MDSGGITSAPRRQTAGRRLAFLAAAPAGTRRSAKRSVQLTVAAPSRWAGPPGLGPANLRSGRSGGKPGSRSSVFRARSASPAWRTAFSPGSSTPNLPASAARSGSRHPQPRPASPPRWSNPRAEASAGAEASPMPSPLGSSRFCCTCALTTSLKTLVQEYVGDLKRFKSGAVTSDRLTWKSQNGRSPSRRRNGERIACLSSSLSRTCR